MLWGVFAFALAVYGYFSEENFALVAGIVVGIIGVRRTVFNFDKIGTFINIVMVFVAITLGALVYFFDGDDTDQQKEVVRESVPKITPPQQPAIKTPATKTARIPPKERSDYEKMACVE